MQEEPEVRCTLVAKELGFGESGWAKCCRWHSEPDSGEALTCGRGGRRGPEGNAARPRLRFLCETLRRNFCSEVPSRIQVQEVEAMYGHPTDLRGAVNADMENIGFNASPRHRPTGWRASHGLSVVMHIDEFLRVGRRSKLDWSYNQLKTQCDLKRNLVGHQKAPEVQYTRTRLSGGGLGEGGEATERCTGTRAPIAKRAPISKDGSEKLARGEALLAGCAKWARKGHRHHQLHGAGTARPHADRQGYYGIDPEGGGEGWRSAVCKGCLWGEPH